MALKTFLPAFAAAAALASAGQAQTLTVELSGVQPRGGVLYVSVQTESEFMQNSGTAGSRIENPEPGRHVFEYDVPAGRYAVSIWHDDDNDGVFDMNEYGLPADGWAMHRGMQLRGAPTFQDISLDVGPGGATVSESMTYGRPFGG